MVVVFLISQNSTVDAALDNGFFAWIDQLYKHFYSIWKEKWGAIDFSRPHFNTVFNSVWTAIRTDFKTFNNVCENAFKRCCLYPPLIPIYDSDGDINPVLLLDANIKLLEKYQNLAITSSPFIFDINDLIRLQKIVSAQPNTPTRQTIANNTVYWLMRNIFDD